MPTSTIGKQGDERPTTIIIKRGEEAEEDQQKQRKTLILFALKNV